MANKTGFKDRIAIKKEGPKRKPDNGKPDDLIWNFRCPQYDERSSCFVNAGTHYGVGHTQPVGAKNPTNANPIPYGRVDTLRIDETG